MPNHVHVLVSVREFSHQDGGQFSGAIGTVHAVGLYVTCRDSAMTHLRAASHPLGTFVSLVFALFGLPSVA